MTRQAFGNKTEAGRETISPKNPFARGARGKRRTKCVSPLGCTALRAEGTEFDRQDFCGAGRRPAAVAGPRGRRLPHPHPDPGARHPGAAGRQGHAGHRPDRHRQDRRVRPAPAAAPRGGSPRRRAAPRPRPGPGAHPRARDPDPRQLQDLRPPSGPAPHGGVRRGRPAAAGQGHGQGRRHPGGDAWPPARPDAAGPHRARPGRVPGAGRGRPDARHGLHPRCPQDRRDPAEGAPVAAVLGDHAGRGRAPGRRHAAPAGPGRGHAQRRDGRPGRAARAVRRDPATSARRWHSCCATRRSPASWCSRAPSTAPTG